jgi:hypothetical protein
MDPGVVVDEQLFHSRLLSRFWTRATSDDGSVQFHSAPNEPATVVSWVYPWIQQVSLIG